MKCWLFATLSIVFVSQCHASVVEITTKTVPSGTAKTYYSAVIAANGGCTPYRWAVVSGKLPSGVLLGAGEHLLRDIDLLKLGYSCIEHVSTPKATHVVLRRAAQ
jgi:hypothetical protein